MMDNPPEPTDLRETYNTIAEDWHKDRQSDTWWIASTAAFAALFKPGNHILDVGCGGGTKSKYFIDKELSVTGIDFSDMMIEIAKREVPRGTFHVMDLANIAELDGDFDGVFLQAVLLHIPKSQIRARLDAVLRKIKPGGYIYISVKKVRPGGPEEEFKTDDDLGYTFQRFFSYYQPEELKSMLQELGCTMCYEQIAPSGRTEWINVIARKDKS